MRALKLVSLAATGPAAFERAQREARILAAAAHPSLVACHGLFEDPRAGLVGLVMDLVPGETLADIAARERLDGEHLDAVIAQIADVLAYIHGRGLVHRDLKPENVLVTDRFRAAPRAPGAIKLVDFGIAVPASNPHRLTATGVVIGTLPYLAPELVDPASWGRTEGPARDVFAFGVMAYHLRFGKHPTRLGPGATLIDYARAYKAAEAGRIAWPPSGLTDTTGAAIASCLALRAADRPSDGTAIVSMLRTGAAPTRASWSGAFGPTTPHREATSSRETPPVVQTEPMPMPVPHARTIAAGPAVFAPRGAPAEKRGGSLVPAIVIGVLAALLVIACAVVIGLWSSSASTQMSSPSPAPMPIPRFTAAATPVQAAEDHGACCNSESECGRRLSRFACPICKGPRRHLPRDVTWQMRIGSVPPELVADRICARVVGSPEPEVCIPRRAMPDATGAWGRLTVSTDDIESKRVIFTFYADERQVAQGAGRRADTRPYLATALCMGLKLYVDGPGGEDIKVIIYLDDR